MTTAITDASFEAEVLKSELPVLVDFWATWCRPCTSIAPILEELSKEYDGRLKIVKLDIDANPDTQMQYGIISIPTLYFFRNGELVGNINGAVPKRQFVTEIEKVLNPEG